MGIYISKEDSECGGSQEPFYFMNFTITDARPIDVFNVLGNVLSGPKWMCDRCGVDIVKNDCDGQIQGFHGIYPAGPLIHLREMYYWLVIDADVTGQDFLIGSSAMGNEPLKAMKASIDGTVPARLCLEMSR